MRTPPPAASQTLKRPDRPDVFICYARDDAEFVWGRLVAALEARGKAVWIDRVDIPPAADWRDRIEKGIDAARAFVFVLSPDSIASYECGQELRQAINANKRLIPVLAKDVEPDDVPLELKRPNWIELRDDDYFDAQLNQLIAALETDLDWLDVHARLAVRAKEWEHAGHDDSHLLRGRDLTAARRWLADQPLHAEAASAQQRAYILASRQAVIRRRVVVAVAVAAAGSLAAVLGVLALVRAQQRQTALAARNLADSRQVAFEAVSLHGSRPDLSMLLAIEAFRIAHTTQARSSLLSEHAQLYAGELPRQAEGIAALAFSPDSRTLTTVTASQVRLWNPLRHAVAATIAPPSFSPAGVAYSPDGNLIAIPTDNAVTLWDARHPQRELRSFPATKLSTLSPAATAISPDGRMLVTADRDGTAQLFAFPSGRLLKVFKLFSQTTDAVAFDPSDASIMAAVGDHQMVQLVNVHTGARVESLPGNSDPIFSVAIAFSPDGNSIATAATGHQVTIWSTRSPRLLATLSGNTNAVDDVAFSPDGRIVATASGRSATLWDASSGTRLLTLPPLATGVDHVRFSPDGTTLAVGSITDGTVSLWRMRAAILLDPFARYRVGFSHRGQLLASADGGGELQIMDARSHQLLLRLMPDGAEPGVGSATRDVTFSPDDRLIATAGRTSAWAWSTRSGAVVSKADVPGVDILSAAAFSPDGHTLAAAGIPAPIVLLDPTRGQIFAKLGGSENLDAYSRLAYTPDGRDLVAQGTEAEIWDVRTGRRLAALGSSGQQLDSIALSPDGRTLATGYKDGSIVLWSMQTGRRASRQLSRFGGHLGPVEDLAFSADGRVLASGGQDATVKLWDVRGAGNLIATLIGHTDSVSSLAYSPDGTLASGGQDGMLITWDLDPQSVARDICDTLRTNLTREDWARYVPNVAYRAIC